jgi:hypothetical protein
MSSSWTLFAVLVLACADIEPPQINPGDDLSGNWLGCAEKSCSTH